MNLTVVRTIATLYVAFSLAPPLLQAADTFRAGESVAFFHEKQWHVGTVVQVERGRAMVSAEVDGEPTQGVFAMNVLRRPPWTLGSRFWSDQSGKFRIKASVVDVTTEALQLLKAEGGTVAVPIDKLSDGDQEIAAKLVAAKQAYQASLATADPTDNEAANSSEPRVMSTDATKSQVDRSEPTSVSAAQSGVRLATLIPLGEQATTSIRL